MRYCVYSTSARTDTQNTQAHSPARFCLRYLEYSQYSCRYITQMFNTYACLSARQHSRGRHRLSTKVGDLASGIVDDPCLATFPIFGSQESIHTCAIALFRATVQPKSSARRLQLPGVHASTSMRTPPPASGPIPTSRIALCYSPGRHS